MNQHYHELRLWGNTGIIVHQKATGTKGFTLTLFFVSSPVMNLPKLLRNRSAELSCEQQKATSAGMVHRGEATGSLGLWTMGQLCEGKHGYCLIH